MTLEDKIEDFNFIIISSENKIYTDNIEYSVANLIKHINLEEALKDLIYNDYYHFL